MVLLVAVVGLVGFAFRSFAESACLLNLEWQPSPDSGVAGYALYYGLAGAPLTTRMDVGLQTTALVKGLTASADYSFYVVAYDANQNEGTPSSPLFYTPEAISTIKLGQASGGAREISFRVAPEAVCRVEYTDTLTPPNWNLLTTAMGDSNGVVTISDPVVGAGGCRFYRGVVQ